MVPKEMQEQKQMTCVGEEKKEDGTEGGRCQTSYTDDRPSSTGAALPRPTVLLRPPIAPCQKAWMQPPARKARGHCETLHLRRGWEGEGGGLRISSALPWS